MKIEFEKGFKIMYINSCVKIKNCILFSMSILVLSIFSLSTTHGAASQKDNSSVAIVDKLGREAISTLTNGQLGQSEIESQFLILLNRDFDVAKISQFVLGRYGKTATPEQMVRFKEIFVHRLKKVYANRFKEYKGVVFTTKDSRQDNGFGIVSSVIQKPGGEPIPVEWWIKGGKINDVVVSGISMKITLRDEYTSLMASHSGNMDIFLSDLEKRA